MECGGATTGARRFLCGRFPLRADLRLFFGKCGNIGSILSGRGDTGDWNGAAGFKVGEDKGRYNNDKLEYMKYLKIRWIAVLLVAVGTSFFFGFKSGDNRSFQVAKNLDIFNSIVKELDMFYVDTIDPDKTIRTGIESMLYSLDPYTQYFPEDDQSELGADVEKLVWRYRLDHNLEYQTEAFHDSRTLRTYAGGYRRPEGRRYSYGNRRQGPCRKE